MKYYYNGRLLFVDMVHTYRYAVLEGDRVITCQPDRKRAEAAAAVSRSYREKIIRQFEKALTLYDVYRQNQEATALFRTIKEDYPTPSLIHAAIRRQRQTLASIRVEPLEVVE